MAKPLYRKDNICLIDNLKALAIVFCAAHFPEGSMFPELHLPLRPLSAAAVPLFILLSAYFMRADIARDSTNFAEKIISMLLLISACSVLFSLPYNALGGGRPYLYAAGEFYLVLLLTWKLITPYMLRLRPALMWGAMAAFFFGVPLANAYVIKLPELPFAFALYTPFFYAGLMVKWEQIVRLRDSSKKIWLLGALLPLLALNYMVLYSETEILFIRPLARLVVSFFVIAALFAYMPGFKISLMSRLGTKSLIIYLFHGFFITWLYGATLYPSLAEAVGRPWIDCVSFAVFCGTLYMLSADIWFRLFNKGSKGIAWLLFKN